MAQTDRKAAHDLEELRSSSAPDLQEALNGLVDRGIVSREGLLMFNAWLKGFSYAEIAGVVDSSPDTVARRLMSVRHALLEAGVVPKEAVQ